MLKKVVLTNIYTSKSTEVIVDTDDDAKAVLGAGKAPNETAVVTDITGLDETLQRGTGKKPNLDEAVTLFGGLARCLERNISTIKSLELMAARLKSPRYRGAVADISHRILTGDKLSDCFAMHPDLFTEDVIALIRAGEESGQIHAVFKQISAGRSKSARILRKLKSGLIYPVIVLILALVVVIVMAFTLIPAISKLYIAMNAQLPLPTQILMAFSDILLKQPYLLALPVIAIVVFFKYWPKIYRQPPVQIAITHLPTIGNIIRKSAAMVSFRTLALLLHANVRISTALEIAAKSSNHVEFDRFYIAVRDHITDGLSLPESFLMESHRLGPDGRTIAAVVQMAGETGGVNEMLDEIATDYEEELDVVASQIDKILEPIVLVMLGCIVGGLVYAIYGPIFNLSKVILPQKKAPAAAVAPH
ncbi:MAG: type II secretion system F family protein [Verrucomicrobiaceae bacterium]|nr:MAG: type II secretion system F family protein [Verrucomicrobiaceae bacterium]